MAVHTYPAWQVPIVEGLSKYFSEHNVFAVTDEQAREGIQELVEREAGLPRHNRVGYSKVAAYGHVGLSRVVSRLNSALEDLRVRSVVPVDCSVRDLNADVIHPDVEIVFTLIVSAGVSYRDVKLWLALLYESQACVVNVAETSTGCFDVLLTSRVPRAILSDWLVDEKWVEDVKQKPQSLFGC